MTKDLGKTVKTSVKFWTILKKLNNFCGKFLRSIHFEYRVRQKSVPAITLHAHALRIHRDVVIVHGWEYPCVTIKAV